MMSFVLAFILVVETPVFAFAEDAPEKEIVKEFEAVEKPEIAGTQEAGTQEVSETSEATEQISESKEAPLTAKDSEAPEASQTSEAPTQEAPTQEAPAPQESDTEASELTPGVVITKGDTEFASDSVTYGDYTTSIKGLPDEKTETVLNDVATVVPELIDNKEICEFKISGSVDAEKYSLDLSDYDSFENAERYWCTAEQVGTYCQKGRKHCREYSSCRIFNS